MINCLIKRLSEIHKSQKLQTQIIPPKIKHDLRAVDYFSGSLRFSREDLDRETKFLARNLGIAKSTSMQSKSSYKVL